MLRHISVRNFAIIENLEVSFKPGMTALTGETGAGKSLLIDAIGLLLGDRASSDMVRNGEQRATVEGLFHVQNKSVLKTLENLGIEAYDGELLIQRQINSNGGNVIRINRSIVTLKELKEVTSKLADIHSQGDTNRLIRQEWYLDMLDGFTPGESERLLKNYQQAKEDYELKFEEYNTLIKKQRDLEERRDFLAFQKQELEQLNLVEGELEELISEIDAIKHYDLIFRTIQEARMKLEELDAIGVLFDVARELDQIASFSEDYTALKKRFEDGYYELQDAFDTLVSLGNNLDFSPDQLQQKQDRLIEIEAIQRKYRKTIPELIGYLGEITEDLENAEAFDDLLKEAKNLVEKAYSNALLKAKELTEHRQKIALELENKLVTILRDLELPQTVFQIAFINREDKGAFQKGYLLENGVDVVDFLITTNVGEPLRPLAKTASGGEMSRIMLALKHVLSSSLNVDLMIFDEIDTGVSGFVAFQVARKMKDIAKHTQVLCITHIPQVASISSHHLHLIKEVKEDRTVATVKTLEGEQRVREIAAMMSGEEITDATLASARELLKQ
jgi:DNA repair protein RecN (Recombination protein N)